MDVTVGLSYVLGQDMVIKGSVDTKQSHFFLRSVTTRKKNPKITHNGVTSL